MSTIGKVLLGVVLGAAGVYAIGKKMNRATKRLKVAAKQIKEPVFPGTELTTDSIIHVSRGKGKEKLWEEACRHLEETLPKDIFEKWIAVIQCRSIEANKVLLVVGNDFHQSWIEEHYLPLIQKALAVVSGLEFQIDLIVDDSLPGEPLEGKK